MEKVPDQNRQFSYSGKLIVELIKRIRCSLALQLARLVGLPFPYS